VVPAIRRLVFAVIAVLALATVYLIPPGVAAGYDYVQYHALDQHYWLKAAHEGRLPLWNPYVGLGRPFAADVQTATFYPPTLLLLLGPRLGPAASILLHLLLVAGGTWSFLRRLGLSRQLADAAALLAVVAGPLAGQYLVGHLGIAEGLCYLPLALALVLRLQDAPSRSVLALLATSLALQLMAGHPQVGWMTWLVLALFLLGRRLHGLPKGFVLSSLRDLGLLALAVLWALALASVVLLPFAELVTQSNRATESASFARAGALSWRQLGLIFFAPDLRLARWLGPEPTFYPGLLVALGGLAGALTVRRREVTGLAFVVVGCVLFALGDNTPAFALGYRLLPGLDRFRLPVRFALPLAFVLLPLACLFLAEKQYRTRHRAALLAAVALAFALWSLPAASLVQASGGVDGALWLRLAVLTAGSTLLFAWTFSAPSEPASPPRNRRRTALAVALAAIAILDVAQALQAWRGAFPIAVPRGEAILAEVLAKPDLAPEGGAPPRVLVPHGVARYNAGMALGYSTPAAYVAPGLGRVWIYIHEKLGIEPPLNNTFPSPRVFERSFPYDDMALVLGYDATQDQLVRRLDPDPRVYATACVAQVPSWREAVRRLAAGHDGHACALVEQRDASVVAQPLAPGVARIVSFAPERVSVRVAASGPTLVVLAEAWYPGWQAQVDGRDVPTLPVNAWMRAALAPEGAHEVVFRYRSRLFAAGVIASLLSLAAVVVALLPRRGRASP
jgi:hypothetical protein